MISKYFLDDFKRFNRFPSILCTLCSTHTKAAKSTSLSNTLNMGATITEEKSRLKTLHFWPILKALHSSWKNPFSVVKVASTT